MNIINIHVAVLFGSDAYSELFQILNNNFGDLL